MPNHLPEDITAIIVEQAYYTVLYKPDTTTLRSCALISRSWSAHSQRLLFRSVHLNHRGAHEVESFLRVISPRSERGQILASHVRSIEMTLSKNPDSSVFSESDLCSLIGSCHRLYEVILDTDIHELSSVTLESLCNMSKSTVSAQVRALSLKSRVQSPVVYQLLQVWPTIQFLMLRSELAAPPPRLPCPIQLYELMLFHIPTSGPFTWLLSNSMQSLQIADFRDLPPKVMDPLLQSLAPRLRSLRLLRFNYRAATVIKFFINLEELVLFQLSSFLGLDGLPQTLEHLSFRNFPWSSSPSLQSVISAIDQLPRLRVVSCDHGTREHPDFALLSLKCRERRIELLTNALPIFAREDPVRATRFPRRKSVSNFALMN